MKSSPLRCGLLKYEMQLQLHYKARIVETLGADILFLGWIYIIETRILLPDAPRWPDMDIIDTNRLFHGALPKTLSEAGKKLDLARGESVMNQVKDRRHNQSSKVIVNEKNLRRFEDPSVLTQPFMHRLGEEPETTEEVHQWVSRLMSLICKPESQQVLDRQENLPDCMYQASEFSKSGKLQRDPKALLEQFRYWLLADEFDLHFDWWGMSRTCTEIWNQKTSWMDSTQSNPSG
jgi:hypothetical protein